MCRMLALAGMAGGMRITFGTVEVLRGGEVLRDIRPTGGLGLLLVAGFRAAGDRLVGCAAGVVLIGERLGARS